MHDLARYLSDIISYCNINRCSVEILYLAGVHRADVGSATSVLTIVGIATIDKVMAIRHLCGAVNTHILPCGRAAAAALIYTLVIASIVVPIFCWHQARFILFGELEKWRDPRSWDVIGHRYGMLWDVIGHVMGWDEM